MEIGFIGRIAAGFILLVASFFLIKYFRDKKSCPEYKTPNQIAVPEKSIGEILGDKAVAEPEHQEIGSGELEVELAEFFNRKT